MNDDLDTATGQRSDQEAYSARQRLAQDQAALFPTRLAMARCRSGVLPLLRGGQLPLRAVWYARLGRDHQAWLDRGGFAQHDEMAPLRKPAMWQPPQPMPAHEARQVAQHHAQQKSQQPRCRPDRDGDARQCGACT